MSETFEEYAVMTRFYRGAEHWQVKRDQADVGWSEWTEFRSDTARQGKASTYATIGRARNVASGQSSKYYGGSKQAKVVKRTVTVGEWEDA